MAITTLKEFYEANNTLRKGVKQAKLLELLVSIVDSPKFLLDNFLAEQEQVPPRESIDVVPILKNHIQSLKDQVSHLQEDAKTKSEVIKTLSLAAERPQQQPRRAWRGHRNNGQPYVFYNKNRFDAPRQRGVEEHDEEDDDENQPKGQRIALVGDSTVHFIKPVGLKHSRYQEKKENDFIVRGVSGANTKKIRGYCEAAIAEDAEKIILHVGTNDLGSQKEPAEIAGEIVQLATEVKEKVPVVISGIVKRGDSLNDKAMKVNEYLKQQCDEKSLNFIDYSDIDPQTDLDYTALHLNKVGQRKFRR